MIAKAVTILLLIVILYTLGSSFYFMVKDKGEGTRTVRRLMWRVGLSIALLAFLYIMFAVGWIEPSGGPLMRKPGP